MTTDTIETRIVDVDRTPIWSNILACEDPQPTLEAIFDRLMQPGSGATALAHGPWLHVVGPSQPLRLSALVFKDGPRPEVRAIYPYTESGYLWPLSVKTIERSSDGGTASVLGAVGPAALGLFDTMSFRTEHRAAPAMPYQVSGIALSIRPDTLSPTFSDDFCGYGPVRIPSNPDASSDVIEVHTIVQATQPVSFWGVALTRYLVTIARTPEHELTFDIYANDALGGPFSPGDRIAAHVWVFGFHPPHL